MYINNTIRNIHEKNTYLEKNIKFLCKYMNIMYRHNTSTCNKYDVYHRYLILEKVRPKTRNAINSKNCIYYSEAKGLKYGIPSQKGERIALMNVFNYLFVYIRKNFIRKIENDIKSELNRRAKQRS